MLLRFNAWLLCLGGFAKVKLAKHKLTGVKVQPYTKHHPMLIISYRQHFNLHTPAIYPCALLYTPLCPPLYALACLDP